MEELERDDLRANMALGRLTREKVDRATAAYALDKAEVGRDGVGEVAVARRRPREPRRRA